MSLYNFNKHSYLLKDLSCILDFNPRLVNRIMNQELNLHTTYRNLQPPHIRLASSIPVVYGPNVDGTRSKIAFGRWALPKLKKEIHHDDILVVMQALNSIHDLIHDPEKCFEAIRVGIVDRLTDMMLHEKDFVREKVCMILYTLVGLEAGKRTVIKRYKILSNLGLLLEDKVDAVKHKAQLVLEMISLSPIAATGLNYADYVILLLRLLGGTPNTADDHIFIFHLATLKQLLNQDTVEVALQHKAMDIFIEKLETEREDIKMLALDCLALLCQHTLGRQEGAEKGLGLILCKKLFDPSMDVRIKVAGALAFATIQSDTRNELCKKCTVDLLVEILENFHSSEGQLMAAKVLSNLTEDPKGKPLVKKMKGRIKNVYTNGDELVNRHLKILTNILKK